MIFELLNIFYIYFTTIQFKYELKTYGSEIKKYICASLLKKVKTFIGVIAMNLNLRTLKEIFLTIDVLFSLFLHMIVVASNKYTHFPSLYISYVM